MSFLPKTKRLIVKKVNTMDILEIGREIQRSRKESKLTQSDVALALNMSPATISMIENGTASEISLRRLMRVMDYVGLEITARPISMGYTLDDAKNDLREKKMKL